MRTLWMGLRGIVLVGLSVSHGLNLDGALSENKLQPICGDEKFVLHPWREPTKSMFFDVSQDTSECNQPEPTLTFESQPYKEDPNFKIGMSLVVLEYINSSPMQVVVRGDHSSYRYRTIDIAGNVTLPNKTVDRENIVRTWDLFPRNEHFPVSITLDLPSLDNSSKVYFVITTYRVPSEASNAASCDSFKPLQDPDWWNCNSNQQSAPLLCINYKLTCDGLPHCAATGLPNPDENCSSQYGLRQALQLLIYTLIAVCIVMFIAGCARCCLRGTTRRHLLRRGSDFTEILAETREPVRPDNAPPTYDDAMKFVNDAFAMEEDEEEPPLYSPQPREGEESGLAFPSGGCSCTREGGSREEERREEERSSEEGAVGFTDDFGSMDLTNLPKDPPAYTR